jgi:methionyl-tRNA synthetase
MAEQPNAAVAVPAKQMTARERLIQAAERASEETAALIIEELWSDLQSAIWHAARDNEFIIERNKPWHVKRANTIAVFLGEEEEFDDD